MSHNKEYLTKLKEIETFLGNKKLNRAFEAIREALGPAQSSQAEIEVFSDGACRGNPGPGSWACFARESENILFEKTGVEMISTNNKMELQGVIEGLKGLIDQEKSTLSVEFFTDSKYVVSGITEWVPGWKKRGWKKSDNKAPENIEFWKELDQLKQKFNRLTFTWVKGHAGHVENERCDQMANQALDDAGF